MPEKSSSAKRRKALGKGLGALLPAHPKDRHAAPAARAVEDAVALIPIAAIDPNPSQPRSAFDEESLKELAQSIRADGLLQPVLVRPNGSRYSLIVGERRRRAAELAGLSAVPAIVRELEPDKILEAALVENIQREDLNPLEIAAALQRMIGELALSHEELAARTGKSRTNITNHLRLLNLPGEIQDLLRRGSLQMGHARALLSLEDRGAQLALADRAVKQKLSVREVERLAREKANPPPPKKKPAADPNVAAAIDKLERSLGTPVAIQQRKRGKSGYIKIFYGTQDDLDRIYDMIVGEAD